MSGGRGGTMGGDAGDRGSGEGSHWLTYEAAGEAMQMTTESARRLATRRRWPRRMGNDGRALVAVPEERIKPPGTAPGTPDDDAGDDAPGAAPPTLGDDASGATGDARALLTYLESRVEELSEELVEARTEARGARYEAETMRVRAGQVDVLTALVETERGRVADVQAAMTALVEIERHRVVEVRAEGKALLDAVAAERDRLLAMVAEQRRPWLARVLDNLRSGHRG